MGHRTLSLETTGQRNTAVGADAGRTTASNDSVFIGYEADEENGGGENVVIGSGAGIENLTPDATGRVLIGYNAGRNLGGNDRLMIENSSSSTPLIGGDFANDRLTVNVDITNPNTLDHTLTVGGSVKIQTLMNLTPSTAPASPQRGDVYYDNTTNKVRVWTGSAWEDLN